MSAAHKELAVKDLKPEYGALVRPVCDGENSSGDSLTDKDAGDLGSAQFV